tara:strand:- start:945 stop:2324 length:1380 start_codon:yes stop_codon:yes gene_type:complete
MTIGTTTISNDRFSMFSAFTEKDFAFLWGSNVSMYIARWMQITTLSWFVLEVTDSPFSVGLVGFFGMAPFFLFGTFGGLLADSVDRKKLVAFTQFMSLTAALIMVLLFAFDLIAYWHSYVAIMIPGLAWALDMSSRRNLIMDIMGMERVNNGVALDSIGEDSGKIIGPALAGLLIAVVGVTGSYIVLTSIIFIGCLSVIRIKIRTSEKRSHNPNADSIVKQKNYMVFLEVSSVYVGQYSGGPALNVFDGIARVFKDLKQGFSYVSKNNVMISVIVITILMNLFLFPYVQMVSVVSKRVLEVGPFFMGLLLASDGLGSLLGSTFLASRRKIKYQGRVYLYCSILSLFGLAAFSLSSIYVLSLLFLVMVGMGVGGFKIMQSALVMIVSDPKFRGRAMGIITLSIGVMPIGNILVGAISQAIGASLTLFAYGFIGFSLVIIAGILMPAVRAEIIPFNDEPKV